MKLKLLSLFVFVGTFSTIAQENVTYQKPSAEILALADYERAPSVSMDTKRIHAFKLSKYLQNIR